jgi:hypothetical protein
MVGRPWDERLERLIETCWRVDLETSAASFEAMTIRPTSAAKVYVALTAVVIVFQLALAAGAPWGELTMAGAFPGRLPTRMRVVAIGSAAILAAFAAVVVARAGVGLPGWHRNSRRLIWVVVAYTVIGVALNAVTPSARERLLWLPVAIGLAASALIVARSARL